MPHGSTPLPDKIISQIQKARLPRQGHPKLVNDANNRILIKRADILYGPKAGKRGWVDDQGRIWIRDRAHAGTPDHWDVQINGGRSYIRVDDDGNLL